MNNAYIYVVARDFGFAPNPFHGYCSLATCMWKVRNPAEVGDWVIGVGGSRLRATGRCVYAMRVTEKITYNEYWNNPRYIDKRPIRNGSRCAVVGDNIYHFDAEKMAWQQADSHHSKPDGSPNPHNIENDTTSQFALLSKHFYYFGRSAPVIDPAILQRLGYKNVRQPRHFTLEQAAELLRWIEEKHGASLNRVVDDPFDFFQSGRRYDVKSDKVA